MGRAVSEHQAHRAHSFYGGLRILCVRACLFGASLALPSLLCPRALLLGGLP